MTTQRDPKEAQVNPTTLIIPGLNGSGPDHWQSVWERERDDCRRVVQAHWNDPQPDAWCAQLDDAVACFTKAASLDPSDPAAHELLGMVYDAQGKVNLITPSAESLLNCAKKEALGEHIRTVMPGVSRSIDRFL